jgi:hypothetical protein
MVNHSAPGHIRPIFGKYYGDPDWRRHAERADDSVSMAETLQRTGMQQPALTARCRKMLPPSVA